MIKLNGKAKRKKQIAQTVIDFTKFGTPDPQNQYYGETPEKQMFYRILPADDSVRADEKLVKTDTVTGTALVSRDTLPEADEALRNKIVFDADGTLYRYDICGKPQIIGKTQKSIKSIFRSQCRRTSAINEQSSWRTLLVTI